MKSDRAAGRRACRIEVEVRHAIGTTQSATGVIAPLKGNPSASKENFEKKMKMVRSAVFEISLVKVSSSSTSRPNGACGTSFCCPSSAASNKSRHHPSPFHFPSRRDLQRRGNDVRSVPGAGCSSVSVCPVKAILLKLQGVRWLLYTERE